MKNKLLALTLFLGGILSLTAQQVAPELSELKNQKDEKFLNQASRTRYIPAKK